MIFINEWLPNPVGDDAKGEFIELFNNGNAPVNLGGWFLKNESGKTFGFSGVIGAQGYLVLKRAETKLELKNENGSLFLYDASGGLRDHSAFSGAAPEGKSFGRINHDSDYDHDFTQNFTWGDPTPGAANNVMSNMQITNNQYPLNTPLNHPSLSVVTVIVMVVGLSLALAAIMLYALKQHEDLSQLFFGRDQGIR